MVILHFASITDSKYSGVCVVVPQHIIAQQREAEVAFVNVRNYRIKNVSCQYDYYKNFKVSQLPAPFNKPDIVVFHEAYRIEYLKIAKELRKNKIPYIIIPHGELTKEAQKKKWLKKKVANLLLFNRFINGAKAVQCLSKRELDSTEFGKQKFIGTNGIALPIRKKEKFSTEGFKLIFIGRLDVYHKGLDILIDAVSSIKEYLKERGAKIEIYGPPWNNNLLLSEKIKNNSLEGLVEVHSEISDGKEDKLLDADVFIQTSRFEGMPMGILEALSYGLPCIVTEGTTLAEKINEINAGWGVETSAITVADSIKKAIEERETLTEKSINAIKLAETEFAWNSIVCQWFKEVRELIK